MNFIEKIHLLDLGLFSDVSLRNRADFYYGDSF